MAFCSSCGTQIPDGTTVCPACSARGTSAGVGGVAAAPASTGGLTDNVAGMLAYFTIIPAILFLVLEPYNKKRFIRFHSFQMIFFCVAMIAIWVGFLILDVIPGLIFVMFPLHLIIWLGAFIVWLILVIKANQGQMFKLPVIGDMAEKQANTGI
jgi:uncharacterized membrane protein